MPPSARRSAAHPTQAQPVARVQISGVRDPELPRIAARRLARVVGCVESVRDRNDDVVAQLGERLDDPPCRLRRVHHDCGRGPEDAPHPPENPAGGAVPSGRATSRRVPYGSWRPQPTAFRAAARSRPQPRRTRTGRVTRRRDRPSPTPRASSTAPGGPPAPGRARRSSGDARALARRPELIAEIRYAQVPRCRPGIWPPSVAFCWRPAVARTTRAGDHDRVVAVVRQVADELCVSLERPPPPSGGKWYARARTRRRLLNRIRSPG